MTDLTRTCAAMLEVTRLLSFSSPCPVVGPPLQLENFISLHPDLAWGLSNVTFSRSGSWRFTNKLHENSFWFTR